MSKIEASDPDRLLVKLTNYVKDSLPAIKLPSMGTLTLSDIPFPMQGTIYCPPNHITTVPNEAYVAL